MSAATSATMQGPDGLIRRVQADRIVLRQAGYYPVPLYSMHVTHTKGGKPIPPQSRGKVPVGHNWAQQARAGKLPVPSIDTTNTGTLGDGLRIVEFDIDDPVIVAKLEALAEKKLGASPCVRYRDNSPRRALLYRAASGKPGKRTLQGVAGKIEVLGKGQQLHILGIHASGVPLKWCPKPPGVISRGQLPEVTEEEITEYFDDAKALIGVVASTPVAPSSTPTMPPRATAAMKPIAGTTAPNASGIVNLPPRPAHLPKVDMRLRDAAMRSSFSFAEVEAAVEAVPDGYPGHPLGRGDPWRSEFLFPLADYATWHPEHRGAVRTLFETHTRRIADPALVQAWSEGPEAYFAAATERFHAEVRNRQNGRGEGYLVGIGRLIHSALGTREEAVAAGWGGRWDGKTRAYRQTEAAAGPPPGGATQAPGAVPGAGGGRKGNGTTPPPGGTGAGPAPGPAPNPAPGLAPFFTPVRTAPADLHRVDWLADGLLIAGDLTVLAGQGGGAKTAFAVMLSAAIAAGRSQCGPIGISQPQPGGLRVAFISAEEDLDRLNLLVAAAAQELQLDPNEWAAVNRNLWLHDARGSGWMLGEARPGVREDISPEALDQGLTILRDALAKLEPALLVLDTAAALLAVPNENDNILVTNMLRRLRRLAAAHGCAILLLHHTPKMTRENAAAQRGEATLVRGGGAWVNTARVVLSITAPQPNEAGQFVLRGADPTRIRRLEHVKVNDRLHMRPVYFETKSVDVQVSDGTDVQVRAVAFSRSGAHAVSAAIVTAVMQAVAAGTTDKHGAWVPLSPPGNGGARNDRNATPFIAQAIQSADGSLSADQGGQAVRGVLKELQELGCLAQEEFDIPKYNSIGGPDGCRKVQGLACRWDKVPAPSDGPASPARPSPAAVAQGTVPPSTWRPVAPEEVFAPGRVFRLNVATGQSEVFEPAGQLAEAEPPDEAATRRPRPKGGPPGTGAQEAALAGERRGATTIEPIAAKAPRTAARQRPSRKERAQ
jgi:hypothetical protein